MLPSRTSFKQVVHETLQNGSTEFCFFLLVRLFLQFGISWFARVAVSLLGSTLPRRFRRRSDGRGLDGEKVTNAGVGPRFGQEPKVSWHQNDPNPILKGDLPWARFKGRKDPGVVIS